MGHRIDIEADIAITSSAIRQLTASTTHRRRVYDVDMYSEFGVRQYAEYSLMTNAAKTISLAMPTHTHTHTQNSMYQNSLHLIS